MAKLQGDDGSGPGALRRGLHILTLLKRNKGSPMSPGQIAVALDIPRPTVYRVLGVLESEAYVTRTDDGKRFGIAVRSDYDAEDFVQRMRIAMKRVADQTGNAVFLVQREGAELVCLHREIGSHPLQILSMSIGVRAPLGVGAAGVALLSRLNDQQIAEVLEENAAVYIEYGRLQSSTIRKLTENCRARGYAVVGNYMLKGVLSVGIHVPQVGARALAAMSVSAPHERLPLSRQKEVAELMRREIDALNIRTFNPAK